MKKSMKKNIVNSYEFDNGWRENPKIRKFMDMYYNYENTEEFLEEYEKNFRKIDFYINNLDLPSKNNNNELFSNEIINYDDILKYAKNSNNFRTNEIKTDFINPQTENLYSNNNDNYSVERKEIS